ncbi:MAG TPA: TonB-dependent receptor [Candidatus Binatus sp.]|nr:TonB-dependent receptor [Candidatus Binatus sp.]
MHAALTGTARGALAAVVAVGLIAFATARAWGDTPASSPPAASAPAPIASPSASPTPASNYLGRVVARAGPREGYNVPIAALERLGARTIGDVLRFVPGVLVRQTGTAGALQTVSLRGDSAAQTLILLDGRPVNEADTGVTDFTSMPLDGVATITVLEGGLSSRYGSGAIGGVVEITTKHASHGHDDSAYAQIGYQGEFAAGAGVSAAGADGGLRVDAFTRYAQNTFDYPGFEGLAGGIRTNSDLHATDVTLCACFAFATGADRTWHAELHVDDNTSEVGVPGSIEFGPEFVSEFARQQRDVQRNSLNLSYGTSTALTSAIFYVDGRRLHFYDSTPSFPYDTLTTATQRGFSIAQTIQAGVANVVLAKYESNGAVALFQGTIDTPEQVVARTSTTELYLGDQYQSRGGTHADAAVQFAHTQGTASTTLPSFALSQQVGGTSGTFGTAVRASYARAFRAPDLDELYFPGFGNPHLQPEYATTFDAGVQTRSDAVDASATFFGSDTNNLIVDEPIDTMGDFLPFNVGRARVRGFDLLVNDVGISRLGWQLAYTAYPTAKDLSTEPDLNGVVTTGNRLLYRPTTTTGIEVLWRTGYSPQPRTATGEEGVDVLVIGRQYGDEENTHLLPPYATVGLHVRRDVAPHLSLLVRVDNLTGQRVPQVYGYPVLGTTFSVRLTAK